jgi:multiple sugar transport system permease protein
MQILDYIKKRERLLFILPVIIILLIFTTFPYIINVILGCFHMDLSNPVGNRYIGLQNFINAFGDSRFWNSISVSGIYVFVATIMELIFGVAIALLFHKLTWGRGFFQSLLLIPMVIPPVVVGLNWRMLYDANYGIINYFLNLLGLPSQAWLAQSQYALLAVLFVDFWQYTPFVILLTSGLLASLPEEQYEAALIDGATGWQLTWKITLPMIKNGLTVVATLRAIEAFKEFAKIYLMTNGGPGTATETLNYYVYQTGFEYFNIGYSSALAAILFAFAIGFTSLFQMITKFTSEEGS